MVTNWCGNPECEFCFKHGVIPLSFRSSGTTRANPPHNGRIVLVLTTEQAKELQTILIMTRDEGPEGEGWQSDELIDLRKLVDAAVRDTEGGD